MGERQLTRRRGGRWQPRLHAKLGWISAESSKVTARSRGLKVEAELGASIESDAELEGGAVDDEVEDGLTKRWKASPHG